MHSSRAPKATVTSAWITLPGKLAVFLLAAAACTEGAVALLASSSTTASVHWSQTSLFSRPPLPSSTADRQQQQLVPRGAFLRSIAFGGAAILLGTPALPATAASSTPFQDSDPVAQFQAGLEDLDRAVSKKTIKIDRAVTKEKNKISKEIKKETKKIDKKIRKEVKKIERENPEVTKKVKKETKKVMREVDKEAEKVRQETEKVRREAKKIGSGLEKKANALVGGNGVAVPQARASGGGIDVSRLKACGEGRNKCVR